MLDKKTFAASRKLLTEITLHSYPADIAPIACKTWKRQLQDTNPLWQHLDAKALTHKSSLGQAHIIAFVDRRLPKLGMIGFFGATSHDAGNEVLRQACDWLRNKGMRDVYGPINGTITLDYRFNTSNDLQIPGEPVNPTWYIDIFRDAGFAPYNQYVSGKVRFPYLYTCLFTRRAPVSGYAHIELIPFESLTPTTALQHYHELMNHIFPDNSIYCPEISFDERIYNVPAASFVPKYCYFAYDGDTPVGFIVSRPYQNSLVLKTIGVLPQYRGKGIADILVRRVHQQAKSDGLKRAIYSTTRLSTRVYAKKRPGVNVFRHYMTLHKVL